MKPRFFLNNEIYNDFQCIRTEGDDTCQNFSTYFFSAYLQTIQSEVRRTKYLFNISYWIGFQKILEMRKKYEKHFGIDYRKFHTLFLKAGNSDIFAFEHYFEQWLQKESSTK